MKFLNIVSAIFSLSLQFLWVTPALQAENFGASPSLSMEAVDHSLEQGIKPNPILHPDPLSSNTVADATLVIDTTKKHQTMAGVGAAFSEIGDLALASLSEASRLELLKNLFDPATGAGFSMCRLPVGSSDFATNAYSYAETPNDLSMEHFSIDRDKQSIIPAARVARSINPSLRFFASPWSPPGWMKTTGRMDGGGKTNTLIDSPKILEAYTRYFEHYLRAYAAEGIPVARLCPQNEMDANTTYPGCVMPPSVMTRLVTDYLAPAFKADGITTELWPGTFREKPTAPWAAECLKNPAFRKAITGLGIQYYNGNSIRAIREADPSLRFMFTEGTCGWGKNTVREAEGHFRELLGAFLDDCDAYAYWNMILDENQKSGWGWKQNSLVTINRSSGAVRYNPDYQILYLASRSVRPGDTRIEATWKPGRNGDLASQATAFLRPNGSVSILLQNTGSTPHTVDLQIDEKEHPVNIPAHSSVGIFVSSSHS